MYGWGAAPGLFECGGAYDAGNPSCWTHDRVASWFPFNLIMSPNPPVVAAPRSPSGAVLTTPPASGEDAQATVDALLNQQLADQQALNAGQVQSSVWDEIEGGTYQAGESIANAATVAFNWLPWALGGILVFGAVALAAGSPRRYGR